MYQIVANRLVQVDDGYDQDQKLRVFLYSETNDEENDLFIQYFNDRHERVKYCKAEEHFRYLSGTIIIPIKDSFPDTECFSFSIFEDSLLLIDDNDIVKKTLIRLKEIKFYTDPTPGKILADIIESMIECDLDYLEKIEDKLTEIEDSVIDGSIDTFNKHMGMIKRETMHYYNYYNQLVDMLETLTDDISDRFIDKDKVYFSALMHRCSRLQNNAQQLREYALQIHDEYQTQLNLHLNNVMKVLTIITVILMPLTLITGWYGMNFHFMPELSWRYGYLGVIVLASLILIFTLWWMRKKKII